MTNSNDKPLSRRNWLGKVTAASIGTGLLAVTPRAFGAGVSRMPEGEDKNSGTRVYNIGDYGAKGDGKTLDTTAVQAAIDACNKDMGGTVLVPAGVFVIGTVEMKSNVTLHVSAGATLLGTADGKQYHAAGAIPLQGDSTLEDGNVGLIFAVNADNFTIEGAGTIDGQGAQFRHPVNNKHLPSPAGLSSHERPYHLLFYRCKNISVNNVFLKDSAYHSVRVVQCSYAKFEGLHIHGRVIYNNDGFHFISSQYVHINNCDVQSQDDACALFGSCKFITISNSSFSTRWSVFRFGGGIAENITVSNCVMNEVFGCPVKMRCGPDSRFENISFSDIIMKDVTGPISIGLGPDRHRNGKTKEPPGIVRNI
ncbi:MAG TPA: glycosyl hydrolase family 28 protein, partial [Chitinophagaceae bacterium]|nr:glycosyl hydrolase family 28 protein [Chitinophagaceae bacterium]